MEVPQKETQTKQMKQLTTLLLLIAVTACSAPDDQNKDFETWYQNVINEPYDPLNGSKY